MFKPKKYDDGNVASMKLAVSQTIAKGDGLAFTGGYLRALTSTDTECRYVALEAVTSAADTHPEILVVRTAGVLFEADTTGNMAQSYVGTKVDATDSKTLNEDAVTIGIFQIENMIGAAADKKCEGFFTYEDLDT
jgi:hypothetical protein